MLFARVFLFFDRVSLCSKEEVPGMSELQVS